MPFSIINMEDCQNNNSFVLIPPLAQVQGINLLGANLYNHMRHLQIN